VASVGGKVDPEIGGGEFSLGGDDDVEEATTSRATREDIGAGVTLFTLHAADDDSA
jgi:hypothetical protein